MLKTIIIICFVLVVNSEPYGCSEIDRLTKNVDLGLKLSKIKEEYLTFSSLQKDLSSQNFGFQTVITFIKTLKGIFDDKVLLQISQSTGGSSKSQKFELPDPQQETYDQLAIALSEIRAISRMFPELEKAQHSFETMADYIRKFLQQANMNIDQSEIALLLSDQNGYVSCKGKKYVLEPNIYESSSSDEEETPNESKESSSTKVTPQVSPQVSPKVTPQVSPKVSPQVQPQVPPQASPKRPLGPQKSQIKYNSKHLKAHKQVKGHLKHKSRHQKQNLISVQKK